ncbi:hypothetical protein L5F09_06045 [Aliarcobacter butzleri]|uniref:cyclophilin-like fold protein n=1 Tax=Aliarcobacter butzleri TaxID=28197 RepID=UPI001EDB68A9|nr:cyclophilin-like fold protein [Aliarcobacter butzleri]MCG3665300.1 hypothetical protein [Aliarcobacter butzleri]
MKQTINVLISILFVFITSIYAKEGERLKISINSNGNTTVYELNNSSASKELYAQLPLNIKVENYSNDEKIFYPPNKLTTSNTSLAKNDKAGTLAYYAPWGDVVMFYKDFRRSSGLYELGKVLWGAEYIESMSGTITIDKME